MKSLASIVFSSVACLAVALGAFGQDVAPAISLGDPVPAFEADPNVVQVSGCQGCQAKLAFQACCEPAKGCTGGCKETIVTVNCPGDCKAPHCSCAAKPTPCKACEVHKHFRPVTATPCATCSAPTPAPCKTCAAPAPAPCSACETKKLFHHHAPAASPCTTCSAPTPVPCTTCKPVAPAPCATCAPAPCKTCIAPAPAPCAACEKKVHHAPACTTCTTAPTPCATCTKPASCAAPAPCAAPCKVAAAPCDTCDPCKTHAQKAAHSRPILDALKGLFNGSGHQHHAPAAAPCSTCTAPAAAQPAVTAQQIPVTAPTTLPAQPVSYEAQQPATVPAAHAPYAAQSTFSTAVPPAEVR